MSPIPALALAGTLSLACKKDCPAGTFLDPETGLCTWAGEGGGGETDGTLGLSLGDPILTGGSYSNSATLFSEFTDAAIIDEDHAILVGVSGFAIADRDDGTWTLPRSGERSTRVDIGGSTAWIATGDRGFYAARLDDLADPDVRGQVWGAETWTYDIAASEDLVAVAYGSEGAWLWQAQAVLDGQLDPVAVVAGGDSTALDLVGDTLAVADGQTVALWDVSDPASPSLVEEAALQAGAMDLALSEDWLVVGLGGSGVQAFARSGAGLQDAGWFPVPGSATGVALDGDHAWAAAWGVVALARLTADGPVVLGHEDATESAFGIAAEGGRAMVADWFHSTAMRRVDGVAGPELHLDDRLYFDPSGADTERLLVRNYGAFDLELQLSVPGDAFAVDADSLVLAPGESRTVLVDSSGGAVAGTATLAWTSNDPDEPSGGTELWLSSQSVGSNHADFSLQGFSWPDPSLSTWTLDDLLGEVTFLAYFATF